ncbi:MAG: CPBP family intramembrane metalloprotease [Candidatus Lokiarchaeota archaeon]|nr:CPBP family intramembrane metalloprotease [Candidatus Harpocratesius repetitus]
MTTSENYARLIFLLLSSVLTNFFFYFISQIILDKSLSDGLLKLYIYWISLAVFTFFSLSFGVWIVYKIFPNNQVKNIQQSKKQDKKKKNNSLSLPPKNKDQKPHLKILFKGFTKKNFFSQIKDGILLFTCIYIPLDFISYLIPGVLDYSVNSLQVLDLNDPMNYFLYNFPLMIITTLFIHFLVASREEFIYREFFLTIGKEELQSPKVFLYSAILFGLAHFNYIFIPNNIGKSVFYPIWWGFNGLIIGLIAGAYFWGKQKIFPLIFAHWINNTFSAIVVRQYVLGYSFWNYIFIYLYIPVLSLALIFYITRIFKIDHLFKIIKKNVVKYVQSINNWKTLALDFFMIGILWLLLSLI